MPNSSKNQLKSHGDLEQHTILQFMEGVIDSVCPVHASSACPATIQSTEPSRRTTVTDVAEDLVEMSAVTGVIDDIL